MSIIKSVQIVYHRAHMSYLAYWSIGMDPFCSMGQNVYIRDIDTMITHLRQLSATLDYHYDKIIIVAQTSSTLIEYTPIHEIKNIWDDQECLTLMNRIW